jgi:hypothetical protein
MEKNSTTPGFFVKKEWGKLFERLSNEEIGLIIKNMYRLDDNEELIEMTLPAEMLFFGSIAPTQEFNRDRYERKITANRMNGAKGGAPVGNQNARKHENITQNNPNQHKERDIVKEKEIVKETENDIVNEIEIVKVKENDIANEIETVNTVNLVDEHLNNSNVLETIDSFTFNQKRNDDNQELDSYNKRDNSLPKGAMLVGEYLRIKNGN